MSYMAYMDTEYDARPWRPADGVVEVAESDGHKTIKTKLDTEVSGLCQDYSIVTCVFNAPLCVVV